MLMRYRFLLCLACCLIIPLTALATSSYPPPSNIRITNLPLLNNEEQAWICPTDSSVIVANWRDFRLGYRQIGVGRSTDGGLTWSHQLIPVPDQFFGYLARQSDPTLTANALGNYFMTALDYNPAGGDSSSTISVYFSNDKGLTWSGPVPAVIPSSGDIFDDKQFTAVDRTGGVHDGNFYMAWARFPNPNQIMFVRSTDNGASFDPPIVIGPNQTSSGCGEFDVFDAGQFANVVVDATGDVHAYWMGTSLDSGGVCSGHTAMKHVLSTDAGLTFTPPEPIFPVAGYMTADGGIATYSQPVLDVDLSGGPFHGNMYMSFTDTSGLPGGASEIAFVRSTDNGVTWSNKSIVNDEKDSDLVDNFHPWMFVNQEGVVVFIYYDQRFDNPDFVNFDLLAAYSFDGGATFTTNHRITTVSSMPGALKHAAEPLTFDWLTTPSEPGNPVQPTMVEPRSGLIGEYIAVSAYYDKVNAVWTDSRDGNSEVYTANWYVPLLEPRLVVPVSSTTAFADPSPTFTWATSWKHDQDRYRLEICDVSDFSSNVASRITDTTIFPFDSILGDGDHFWRVKAFTTDLSDSSEYSEIWQFQTDTTPPPAPLLIAPSDLATVDTTNPTFEWSFGTGVVEADKDLFLSSDPNFTPGPGTFMYQIPAGTDSDSLTIPDALNDGETYYWYVIATDPAGNDAVSDTAQFLVELGCCVDPTGNVNADALNNIDITDLTLLVNHLFVTFEVLACPEEADTNGDSNVDISDLTRLVNYLFVTFVPTADCL